VNIPEQLSVELPTSLYRIELCYKVGCEHQVARIQLPTTTTDEVMPFVRKFHAPVKAMSAGKTGGSILKFHSLANWIGPHVEFEAIRFRNLLSSLVNDFKRCNEARIAAASRSDKIVPILSYGMGKGGLSFVMPFYGQSLKAIINARISFSGEKLCQIARSIVAALRDLNGPHGNLKATNIFLHEKGSLASVLLSDLVPFDDESRQNTEREDLRSIGILIFQLVTNKEKDMTFPLVAEGRWKECCGKKVDGWIALCNRLIDPATQISLEELERELLDLRG